MKFFVAFVMNHPSEPATTPIKAAEILDASPEVFVGLLNSLDDVV
jgi:hypothetical protein